MRCKTLSHKSLLQFYGVVGLLRHSDRGVMMLIGYARVSTQETKEQSPEKRRRTPLTTFWAAETQLGEPPHCVRSRLRRMQAPQRSSETPRLACKIAPNLPDTLGPGREGVELEYNNSNLEVYNHSNLEV